MICVYFSGGKDTEVATEGSSTPETVANKCQLEFSTSSSAGASHTLPLKKRKANPHQIQEMVRQLISNGSLLVKQQNISTFNK